MSCVEIYAFSRDGRARLFGRVQNSWLGPVATWSILEKRHLPPLSPDGLVDAPSRVTSGLTKEGNGSIEEIFALFDSPWIPRAERLCLGITFDDILAERDILPELIAAMRGFAGPEETNLPEQADVLEEILKNPEVVAVGWTPSVSCSPGWDSRGEPDPETGEETPYNCLTGTGHIWLGQEMDNPLFEKGGEEK